MERSQKTFIVIVIVLIIIGGVAYFLKTSADAALKAKAELNNVIEPMLTDISSVWSPKVFYKYSTPELKDWLKTNGWSSVSRYSQLGKMTKYNGIETFDMGDEKVILTSYADFENGKTKIELNLLKSGDNWYIQNIQINPAN